MKRKKVVIGLLICLVGLYLFRPSIIGAGAADVRIALHTIDQCASAADWSKGLTLSSPNMSWVTGPFASFGYTTACLRNAGMGSGQVSYTMTIQNVQLLTRDGSDTNGITLAAGSIMPAVIKWVVDGAIPTNQSFSIAVG